MYKAYTYYLYHVPTGKKYYGYRYANKCEPEQDLWVYYFSSSDLVEDLIEQYGKESFQYQVRKMFDTQEEAHTYEQTFLHRVKAIEKKDWLNQAYSNGPFYFHGPFRPETIEKIRHSKIGNKNGVGNKSRTGQKNSEITRSRLRDAVKRNGGAHNKGLKTRDDVKEKQSIAATGKIWIFDIFSNEERKIRIEEKIPNGWARGRKPFSKEHLQKMKPRKGYRWYHNIDSKRESRYHDGDTIPNDWILGRLKKNVN